MKPIKLESNLVINMNLSKWKNNVEKALGKLQCFLFKEEKNKYKLIKLIKKYKLLKRAFQKMSENFEMSKNSRLIGLEEA